MNTLSELLSSRAGVQLAALAVSWIAILFLSMVVANLHARLRMLESKQEAAGESPAYAHLVGKSLSPIVPAQDLERTRIILLLSRSCSSCLKLLQSMTTQGWDRPVTVAWTGEQPESLPQMPTAASYSEAGPAISASLGVRITPFALILDSQGTVIQAGPVHSTEKLGELASQVPAAKRDAA